MPDHDTLACDVEHALSRAQLRLWFLSRLRPHDPAYTLVTAVGITGQLNSHALAEASSGVLREHPALVSLFGVRDGSPFQRYSSDPPPMTLVDLSGLEASRSESALRAALNALAGTPIDLVTGPIARWWLIRLDEEQHVLVFVVHHIVFDGGSLEPISTGLASMYATHTSGRPHAAVPPVPLNGQRSPEDETQDEASAAFWQRTLAGAPIRLDVLPAREIKPVPQEVFSVCTVTVTLGPERVAALTELAARARCTPFIVLLSIFSSLVARYSGQPDVVIGTPISLREGEHPPVGLSLNMLPLRLDLRGSPSLDTALRRTRDVVLDAVSHRYLAFESIVDSVAPVRDPEQSPIFQVVFAHQASPPAPQLPGLRTRVVPVDAVAAKYPLTVVATETGGDIELAVQADLGATDRDAVHVFAANLDLVITGALTHPGQALSSLPVLGRIDGAGRSGRGDPVPDDIRMLGVPSRPGTAGGRRWPAPGLEQEISALWCSVLDTAGVDAEQTFFEQGGTSLALLRLHEAMLSSIAPDLELVDLFRYASVEQLAAHIRPAGRETAAPAAPVAPVAPAAPARPDPAQTAALRGARRRQSSTPQRHD